MRLSLFSPLLAAARVAAVACVAGIAAAWAPRGEKWSWTALTRLEVCPVLRARQLRPVTEPKGWHRADRADSARLLSARLAWRAGADKPDLCGPQLDQAYAQRDQLIWAEWRISQVRQTCRYGHHRDDSAGFYAYVPRYPQRAEYVRGELSAGTAGGPIAAIMTAVRMGNR